MIASYLAMTAFAGWQGERFFAPTCGGIIVLGLIFLKGNVDNNNRH
jgi:hypothetical protein